MAVTDLFLTYMFLKKLTTPFKKWNAYKHGIIDENGNILRKRKTLNSADERKSWGRFDLMISKLKRLIEKVPGGKTRILTYAAALYLIKESHFINSGNHETMTENELIEVFDPYLNYVNDNCYYEETPVNSAGSGDIAGIGVGPRQKAEPGFNRSQMKKYKKKNQIISIIKR